MCLGTPSGMFVHGDKDEGLLDSAEERRLLGRRKWATVDGPCIDSRENERAAGQAKDGTIDQERHRTK